MAIVGAAIAGIGNGVETVAARTALQEEVEDRWMALMMALNESLFQSVPGAGILLGGAITALGARGRRWRWPARRIAAGHRGGLVRPGAARFASRAAGRIGPAPPGPSEEPGQRNATRTETEATGTGAIATLAGMIATGAAISVSGLRGRRLGDISRVRPRAIAAVCARASPAI